ncbi:MAG TPA: YciI family protein [Aestuariivirga sp.]|nr:YciI family protein [Aestuariivirga sp.]
MAIPSAIGQCHMLKTGMVMLFIVRFEDIYAEQPDRLPERALHMPAHLAFLAKHADKVVAAGALRDEPDGIPSGGLWILNVENKAAAKALYELDPFWIAGLRRQVRVSYWAKAFWSPVFSDCMKEVGANSA